MLRSIEKIAKIKYCNDLMKNGMLKRDALNKANTHSNTFDRYIEKVNSLTEEETKEVDAVIESIKDKKKIKKVAQPVNKKKYPIVVSICDPYYTAIVKEAEKMGCAPSVIARSQIYKYQRDNKIVKVKNED